MVSISRRSNGPTDLWTGLTIQWPGLFEAENDALETVYAGATPASHISPRCPRRHNGRRLPTRRAGSVKSLFRGRLALSPGRRRIVTQNILWFQRYWVEPQLKSPSVRKERKNKTPPLFWNPSHYSKWSAMVSTSRWPHLLKADNDALGNLGHLSPAEFDRQRRHHEVRRQRYRRHKRRPPQTLT